MTVAEALSYGPFLIDLAGCRAFCNGRPIRLGPTQFKVLCILVAASGRTLSRDELLAAAWGSYIHVVPRTVDVHVRLLRRAIDAAGGSDFIRTVRLEGYALCAEEQPEAETGIERLSKGYVTLVETHERSGG